MAELNTHKRLEPIPEHSIRLGFDSAFSDHQKLRAVLEPLGLFGDQFFYTAVHSSRLDSVRRDGTYLRADPLTVFPNRLQKDYTTGEITFGDDDKGNLFAYLFDTLGDGDPCAYFVVYRASAFGSGDSARFLDQHNTRNAVAAIIRIEDFEA